MTLGEGAVISMSNKQKLNVKISTEGELVGADVALGQVNWKKTLFKDRDIPWNTTQCIKIIDQPCYSKRMVGFQVERELNISRQDIIWLKTQLIGDT